MDKGEQYRPPLVFEYSVHFLDTGDRLTLSLQTARRVESEMRVQGRECRVEQRPIATWEPV